MVTKMKGTTTPKSSKQKRYTMWIVLVEFLSQANGSTVYMVGISHEATMTFLKNFGARYG